jgi:hypothetical protein
MHKGEKRGQAHIRSQEDGKSGERWHSEKTNVLILALERVPAMSFFHASWVSRTMAVVKALSLASPLNANVFSGLPAGIL